MVGKSDQLSLTRGPVADRKATKVKAPQRKKEDLSFFFPFAYSYKEVLFGSICLMYKPRKEFKHEAKDIIRRYKKGFTSISLVGKLFIH